MGNDNSTLASESKQSRGVLGTLASWLKVYLRWSAEYRSKLAESGKRKCPRCNSTNLNAVKPSLWRRAEAAALLNLGGKPKTLNVCRDCSFSWEDR